MRSDVTAPRVYRLPARRPAPTAPGMSVRERVRVVRAATDRAAPAAHPNGRRRLVRGREDAVLGLVDELGLALRDDELAERRHRDREVARDLVARRDLDERRHLGGALVMRLEAARPEHAAAGRVNRRGKVALEQDPGAL